MNVLNWFRKKNDYRPPAEQTPSNPVPTVPAISRSQQAGQSIFWRGAHPGTPYGIYTFMVSRCAEKRFADDIEDTHCIRITLTVAGRDEVRLLYEKIDNFECPGYESMEVVNLTASMLFKFLITLPNPKRVPGAFDLLFRGEEFRCPFEAVYANYRRELLWSQLRKLGITYDQFIADKAAYNRLRGA